MPYGLRKRGATYLQSKYNQWGKIFKWNKSFKANNTYKCWTENEYLNDRRLHSRVYLQFHPHGLSIMLVR